MQEEMPNMIVRIEDVIDYLHGKKIEYPKPHHPMTDEDTRKYLIYQAISLANAKLQPEANPSERGQDEKNTLA
jgi:hypothetical protein